MTALLLLSVSAALAQQQEIPFIAVEQGDKVNAADQNLIRYLKRRTKLPISDHPTRGDYGATIQELARRSETRDPYLARMTPYAFVVAEMLGVPLQVLGVYHSAASASTTYRAHFVVNSKMFRAVLGQADPTLHNLTKYIEHYRPAKFIYHNKFSTSSYFVPSLYFRGERIFSVRGSSGVSAGIDVQEQQGSSDQLVEKVAAGAAHLAAVADANRDAAENNRDVAFIQLPTLLPNDLLVCPPWLPPETQKRLRAELKAGDMNIGPNAFQSYGDFLWWEDFAEANEAREALAALRHGAVEPPAPVTVAIEKQVTGDNAPRMDVCVEAAYQALRLSGTEFVAYDTALHKRRDAIWRLELTASQSLLLTSTVQQSGIKPQLFRISFSDVSDLTKRIVDLVRSRMHRVRYVWPYQDDYPVVIRDVDFSVGEAELTVQRVAWLDPKSNEYQPQGSVFRAKTEDSNFYRFKLTRASEFPLRDGKLDFEPMSNTAYRVVLERASAESGLMRGLTVAFVGLLLLAAAGFVVTLVRKPGRQQAGISAVDGGLFDVTCRRIAVAEHATWQQRQITDVTLLWCGHDRIVKVIDELKPQQGWTNTKLGALKFGPIEINLLELVQVFWRLVDRRPTLESIGDASRLPKSALVDRFLAVLLKREMLSQFVGRPVEWDALGQITVGVLRQLNGERGPDAANGNGVLHYNDPMIQELVSAHFNKIIEETSSRHCLFHLVWELRQEKDRCVLRHTEALPGELRVAEGAVSELTLEAVLPPDFDIGNVSEPAHVNAWVLGKMSGRPKLKGHLCLRFEPLAVLRG